MIPFGNLSLALVSVENTMRNLRLILLLVYLLRVYAGLGRGLVFLNSLVRTVGASILDFGREIEAVRLSRHLL